MRFLMTSVLFLSLALFVGCAATSSGSDPAHTCCKNSPTGTCVDCPACSAGQSCADCKGQCVMKDSPACATCASGEACAECAAKKAKPACAACAAGEKCADCAAKDGGACTVCGGEQAACATCAAGEPCATCDAKKAAADDKASNATTGADDDEPVATINAKGMGCPLCASSADRRLMKVDGVKWTNIDLGNGIVTVGLDPEKPAPAAEDLQAAIRDAGFTAEDVTMPNGEVTQ